VNPEVIEYVPVDRLATNPQVRKHFDDHLITGLAISLQQEGMQNAIRARRVGEKIVITCGERRYRAAIKAGLKEVPVIIEQSRQDDAATICAQLIENIQRCDLLPIEKAEAFEQLMKANNWSEADLGRRIGMSASNVCKHVKLLTLPEDIKAELRQGKIPLKTAYELTGEADPVKQSQLAAQAAAGQLTCDGVKAAKRQRRAPAKPAEKRPTFRMKIASGNEGKFSLSGPIVPLKRFISSLEDLLARARDAERQGTDFSEFVNQSKSIGPPKQ
jgi:ParB family chromosome partitioning protein